MREAVRAIYRDDLGAAFGRYFDTRATALIRLLEGAATGRDWCDDRTTPERESCGAMLAGALNARARRPRSPLRHRPVEMALGRGALCASASIVRSARWRRSAPIFNVEVPSPGGNYTLNRGKPDFGEEPPFANRHASSYRAIYDFADLERSLYIHTTGQSGNPLSPYYRSFAERWAKVEYIEIATRREEIAKAPLGTWKLMPK